jgi:FtsP/CotA-like multicopper oxidase with cupredoxin domain
MAGGEAARSVCLLFPGALASPAQNAIPTVPRDPAPLPEFFGDTMCVNGAVGPFMTVEPRLYRFRIINGCNARFINLDWKPSSLTGARPPMHVIGSDGGLLPKATTTPTLVIAPGERYDILVDFSAFAGERINLANRTPFPAPVVNPASPLPRVMQFLVTAPLNRANQPAVTFNPAATLTTDTPATALNAPGAAGTRYHSFEEVMGKAGPLGAVINGKTFARSSRSAPSGRPCCPPRWGGRTRCRCTPARSPGSARSSTSGASAPRRTTSSTATSSSTRRTR